MFSYRYFKVINNFFSLILGEITDGVVGVQSSYIKQLKTNLHISRTVPISK